MTFGLIIKMVEGLVNLSEINQNLINFDEAINLILSLKKYIVVKTKKITLNKSIGRILRVRYNNI